MTKTKPEFCTRRSFLTSLPAVFVGSSFLDDISGGSCFSGIQELKSQLTEKEAAWIKQSQMAQELETYFSQGYSCAESILYGVFALFENAGISCLGCGRFWRRHGAA